MKNFKCTLIEQGIHIQGEAQDLNGKDYPVSLLISYDQVDMPWGKGIAWAAEHHEGATAGTRAQWMAIQEHRGEINELLKEAGKRELAGWYWTREEYANNNSFAWCVGMGNGTIYCNHKNNTSHVRAVSAFQI